MSRNYKNYPLSERERDLIATTYKSLMARKVRTVRIQPRKRLYTLFEEKDDKRWPLAHTLQYTNELAIAWALRELHTNRQEDLTISRAVLILYQQPQGEIQVQTFRRKDS